MPRTGDELSRVEPARGAAAPASAGTTAPPRGPDAILAMQRSVGNQATARMLHGSAGTIALQRSPLDGFTLPMGDWMPQPEVLRVQLAEERWGPGNDLRHIVGLVEAYHVSKAVTVAPGQIAARRASLQTSLDGIHQRCSDFLDEHLMNAHADPRVRVVERIWAAIPAERRGIEAMDATTVGDVRNRAAEALTKMAEAGYEGFRLLLDYEVGNVQAALMTLYATVSDEDKLTLNFGKGASTLPAGTENPSEGTLWQFLDKAARQGCGQSVAHDAALWAAQLAALNGENAALAAAWPAQRARITAARQQVENDVRAWYANPGPNLPKDGEQAKYYLVFQAKVIKDQLTMTKAEAEVRMDVLDRRRQEGEASADADQQKLARRDEQVFDMRDNWEDMRKKFHADYRDAGIDRMTFALAYRTTLADWIPLQLR